MYIYGTGLKVPRDPGTSGRTNPGPARVKELWADPEWRAALLAKRAAVAPYDRSRTGVPPGLRKPQVKWFWRQARFEAALTMKKLDKAGLIEEADENAREALKEALAIMRGPVPNETRLKAARLVLDFTKAKPAQRQEVTISKAEEWLAAVVADAKETDEGSDSGA